MYLITNDILYIFRHFYAFIYIFSTKTFKYYRDLLNNCRKCFHSFVGENISKCSHVSSNIKEANNTPLKSGFRGTFFLDEIPHQRVIGVTGTGRVDNLSAIKSVTALPSILPRAASGMRCVCRSGFFHLCHSNNFVDARWQMCEVGSDVEQIELAWQN